MANNLILRLREFDSEIETQLENLRDSFNERVIDEYTAGYFHGKIDAYEKVKKSMHEKFREDFTE